MLRRNTFSDDRLVDGQPAQGRPATLDMLGGDSPCLVEVGAVETSCPRQDGSSVWVGRERHHLATSDRGQTGRPVQQAVGAGIVADGHSGGLRTRASPTLSLALDARGQRLTRPHPRLHHQLRWQARMRCPHGVIGGLVPLDAAALLVLPAVGSHRVEARGRLQERVQQDRPLLRQRLQPQSDRSLHTQLRRDFAWKEVRAAHGAAFRCHPQQAVSGRMVR